MSPRAAIVRIARALHAWLGRWLEDADDSPPPTERTGEPLKKILVSQFPITRDPDEEEEAEAWYRAHFTINGHHKR
jgi:hypothetical protein